MCARVDTTVKDLCQPVDAYSGKGYIGIIRHTHAQSLVESYAIPVPTLVACGLPVDNLWITCG